MKASFDPKKNLALLFPTRVGKFTVSDKETLAKVAEVILARENKEEGITRSNKGGWHSEELLHWPEIQFADLGELFRSSVAQMMSVSSLVKKFNVDLALSAWANVNRKGAFNSPHNHPRNHWSGVLYVQIPDFSDDPIDRAGNIEFQDPRGASNMMKTPGDQGTVSFPAEEGVMLLFPSWLYHWVNPFSSDATRISIAFNARIRKYEELD